MITQDDQAPATKADIQTLLKVLVTKDDAKNFATKDDLKNFATKNDLKNFATKNDLKNFATKNDLKNFATKDDIKGLERRMNKRFDNMNNSIDLVIENLANLDMYTKKMFQNHERRINHLETLTA